MTEQKTEFEPKIVGFLCNWCSYAGADLAGVSRIQYPPNIRIIRVMCSGRVDPAFILEAFKDGADGVLVAGCHLPSDCHYLSGNFKAQRRVTLLKKVLEQFGIEPERLRLEWISASEGDKFATVVKDMTAQIKKLGMPCATGPRPHCSAISLMLACVTRGFRSSINSPGYSRAGSRRSSRPISSPPMATSPGICAVMLCLPRW